MYLLIGISKRVLDPNEILFDRAHKENNSDINKFLQIDFTHK